MHERQLAPPGAGIPFIELMVAKFLLMPYLFSTRNETTALIDFNEESERILSAVSGLSDKNLGERRLVPRLTGMEDSSRFWSVAMTLEHLVIVDQLIERIVIELCENRRLEEIATIPDVKPNGSILPAEAVESFRQVSQRFQSNMRKVNLNNNTTATYPHPWFGELSARQWLIFAAPHQSIHRKQITSIIERLT